MASTWTQQRAVAVAIGGAIGATVRWLVVTTAHAGRFPWPVLAINIAGSFVLGLLLAEELTHPTWHLVAHDAGAIGFCGGLTTFSTFAVEVVNLVRDGQGRTAAVYGTVSVLGAVSAIVAGAALLRRVRALVLPVEEDL